MGPLSETGYLERVQRHAARFTAGDYRMRKEGSVTGMLQSLELSSLENRSNRLINHSAVYILFWSFEISDNILRNQK